MNFRFDRDPISLKEEDKDIDIENNQNEFGENNTNIVEGLASFSVKYDNPFFFEDFGSISKLKSLEDIKINPLILEDLKKEKDENEYREDVKFIKDNIEFLHSFTSAPIFTDSYHENHALRREWENKFLGKMDSDLAHQYRNNPLGVNNFSNVFNSLHSMEDTIISLKAKNQLESFEKEIPEELKEKDEHGFLLYNTFSDDKKVELIKKLKKITKNILVLLEGE